MNQNRKQHKVHTCFYKLSLKLAITFVLQTFLCCYLSLKYRVFEKMDQISIPISLKFGPSF